MLDLLLLDNTQRSVLLFVLLFAGIAWGCGRAVGSRSVQGTAFGFLVLGGASALALFTARALTIPTSYFAVLTLAYAAAIVAGLRLALPPEPPATAPNRRLFVAVSALITLVLWTLRVIQIEPSSNLSSHHGWYPLYIMESFRLGHFAQVEEMAFGHGYLTSIFYNMDLMGLVALGEWAHPGGAWAAYSAGSTLASILAVVLGAQLLRRSRAGLVVYGLMVMALLATDFLFRTVLARNWGDAILYLGGALMLFHLARNTEVRRAALWTAATAIFLVFSRHYGAFYAGAFMVLGFAATWRVEGNRRLKPWLVLGVMSVLFAAREIWCFVRPPSDFYPGQKLVEAVPSSLDWTILGILNDFGVLNGYEPDPTLVSPRNVYLLALVAIIVLWAPRLWRQGRRRLALAAPLALFALPQLLQALTGYRSSWLYSKTMLISLLLPAFLPALAAAVALPDRRLPRLRRWMLAPAAAVAITVLAAAAWVGGRAGVPVAEGPKAVLDWAFARYRAHNTDLDIARKLVAAQGARFDESVRDRPILYFHFEPGLAIRQFTGGSFFCDLDFWSAPVRAQFGQSASLHELIARLGYPNIYMSYGSEFIYGSYFKDEWPRFAKALDTLRDDPLVERVIVHDSAVFLVTRPGAGATHCPAGPTAPLAFHAAGG